MGGRGKEGRGRGKRGGRDVGRKKKRKVKR